MPGPGSSGHGKMTLAVCRDLFMPSWWGGDFLGMLHDGARKTPLS